MLTHLTNRGTMYVKVHFITFHYIMSRWQQSVRSEEQQRFQLAEIFLFEQLLPLMALPTPGVVLYGKISVRYATTVEIVSTSRVI